jgi:CheY-like chemotaxis protein
MTATPKPRILVVDDDASMLRVVSMRLDKEGYRVATAESAQKALALLDTSPTQLVLTDLRMAGMDGLALFEAVTRHYPGFHPVRGRYWPRRRRHTNATGSRRAVGNARERPSLRPKSQDAIGRDRAMETFERKLAR